MNKETGVLFKGEKPWHEDYGIKTIKSMKAGEAYCVDDGFKIDESFGGQNQLQDNYKIIRHNTFSFLLITWIDTKDSDILKRCLVNIEKLLLLSHLGVASAFHVARFVKAEGAKIITVSEEIIEDIATLNLDAELKKATENKEIYYFQRVGWKITQREAFNPGDATVMVRARFNFLVLDKE
jgi:hypothetical protein